MIKKRRYPHLGENMKTPLEIAEELNRAHGLQLEAERQKRHDIMVIQKARYETLLWVLGKDNASTTIR
jgi:hypothetical protein